MGECERAWESVRERMKARLCHPVRCLYLCLLLCCCIARRIERGYSWLYGLQASVRPVSAREIVSRRQSLSGETDSGLIDVDEEGEQLQMNNTGELLKQHI